ncbi:MAG: hypothetical protein KUG83_07960 [Gammaproteobacteria bacterium]|nr:hypothetical protein [Gammaproteobacteria bacterium]
MAILLFAESLARDAYRAVNLLALAYFDAIMRVALDMNLFGVGLVCAFAADF